MLERVERDGIAIHTDPVLFETSGIGLAFTERGGGVSQGRFSSLNLAGHVGDSAGQVDNNRTLLLESIGIGTLADRLTTAEQVHGGMVVEVGVDEAGAGASVCRSRPPIPGADALWTRRRGVPLLLLYADCVPIVLVRPSVPAVAVIHAGWRGATAGIVSVTAHVLAGLPGEDDLAAFVGPHIGACCYEVGPERVARFDPAFVTSVEDSHRLDLGGSVAADLERSGVPKLRRQDLGICTAHNTDRFYSYRAEGQTGRHGALAVIL